MVATILRIYDFDTNNYTNPYTSFSTTSKTESCIEERNPDFTNKFKLLSSSIPKQALLSEE